MKNRIIRDIRYFEIKPDNYQGEFDGTLGNIFHYSPDTMYIGQRIARKLNEFEFVSGEFDHIYINLSPKLKKDEISESNLFLDKQLKYFDYGLLPSTFNNLSNIEKNNKIKEITFKVLNWIYKNDDLKTQLINKVKNLIDKYDKHLLIKFKTKETSQYLIELNYKIRPDDEKSKLIIKYTDKKENNIKKAVLDIFDYGDLYSLVDTITLKDGFIVFKPKKSYHAEFVIRKYINPPLNIEINRMKKNE